jgi:hypothetical protein
MRNSLLRCVALLLLTPALAACQSAYYGMAEKVGYHKREILVDRVGDSQEAQRDAQEQFRSALEQLGQLTGFDGGELEKVYEEMADEYEESEEAAAQVRERIDAVEHVAGALFGEWQDEIEEYTNPRLKADSQAKLRETRRRYDGMIAAMRRSEARMEPVLAALRDNVLYLKHNLNARAIASIKTELTSIENDTGLLIREMERSIAESDAFIASME